MFGLSGVVPSGVSDPAYASLWLTPRPHTSAFNEEMRNVPVLEDGMWPASGGYRRISLNVIESIAKVGHLYLLHSGKLPLES